MDLYTWACESIKGIAFQYCSREEVQLHSEELTDILCGQVSNIYDTMPSTSPQNPAEPPQDYQPGMYVACMYDGHWWLGNIIKTDYDQDDVKVTFMHPCGPASNFRWPRTPDICWVPTEHILTTVDISTATGRNYTVGSNVACKVTEKTEHNVGSIRKSSAFS